MGESASSMASLNSHFHYVTDYESLERLFQRSHDAAIILFKHSNACPISSSAYREMERVGSEVAIVVVQKSRDISNEVATRTGVPHQSPQALLIRNGEVIWSASHYGVTADAVEQALSDNAR